MPQQQRRSRFILGVLALGLLTGAALTAGPAQAVDAVGPYYAEPAWDRKLACLTFATCPRFVVLTNWNSEAVLDKETGLVWEKSPNPTAQPTWSAARLNCTGSTTGNRKGWRLPSIHELTSLIDPTVVSGPTLPPGHPFVTVFKADYWSATTNVENPANAWGVGFDDGGVGDGPKTITTPRAWCVRGGNNADQY
jgi:hypothetical protein